MINQTDSLVFINYRSRDSSVYAHWLGEIIAQNCGNNRLFLGTGTIQIGDIWSERIQAALERTSVLIVMIGPEWLRTHDEFGRRRLDDPDDWVRREIVYALEKGLLVLPLLVSNAELPDADGLPDCLKPLLSYQASRLRDEDWQQDVKQLLDKLQQVGFENAEPLIEYPTPGKRPRELTDQELGEIINRFPEWRLVARRSPDGKVWTELMRTFKFASFDDAIHFMSTASRHISKVKHHPTWENVWRTITVWLSTWDIGHKPSSYDLDLAEYLDELYRDYQL